MINAKVSSILTKYIQPLSSHDTVEIAILIMKEHHISSVIICDNDNKPIGIFTEYDSLKIVANETQRTSILDDVMSKNIFCIDEDNHIHDGYILMEERQHRHIVVVDKQGHYKGVVTEGDFLRHMGFEEAIEAKSISEAMSELILTVNSNISIIEAAKLMSDKKCDYAIVVKNDIPLSIVTERSITLFASQNIMDNTKKISELPHTPMQKIDKKKSLREAATLMQEHSIHQLLVVNEKEQLIGLITRQDVLKSIHGSYFDFLLQTIEEKTKKEYKLKEQAFQLKKLANYDILTNLPNKFLFQKILEKSLSNAIRNNHTIAVLIFDIDRFRDINDSYGHSIGDELLSKIASRFTEHVREGDTVSRLGGNEFAMILEHIDDINNIPKIAKHILNAIAEPIELSNACQVSIETCTGVVIAPKDTQNPQEIIQFANSALHQAKKEGSGICKYYTDEFLQQSIQKVAFESSLRSAIQNNELELYYQPKVHLHTDKIIGAEALLRWKNKDGEMISPAIFIPIADETGLINTIGEWVIYEACRQGKIWLDAGYHITVAVNVSANQVKYQDLSTLVANALSKHNYDPHKLEIEITESALMQREEEAVAILHSLRAKGIKLAIDDFGTGYSSLSYLKRFPIDVLKIDKSFVDDIPYEKDDCAIVTAIIEMGKALGYEVLAEGTERQEQLDYLKEKGCNLYQGYIKSKALPAQEFEELLKAQTH